MQVTETLNDGLKRGYQITLTAQELDAKVMEKLTEAQPGIQMKGFRKGKVPLPLLKKQYGPQLLGEAMQETIDGAMSKHFEETGDRPAFQPEVKMTNENWKEGDAVEVAMTYEKLPEIPEVDLKGLQLEKLVVKATDAEIDEALQNLASNAKTYEDRFEGGYAEKNDRVTMDFVGKVDGEAFEGGSMEDHALVLGSGQFIPGFEEQLEGVHVGDERTVTVSFPEDYRATHLAGKEATFDCTIKRIETPIGTPIDDELAKKYGAESLDALKGQIAERLEAEYAGASRQVQKRALLDKLDALVSFDLPPSLVEAEASQIAHQLWHEENPEVHDHNHGSIETTDEHKRLAVRRVRLGLFLAELGRKNEIEVTDAEMTQAVMAQARQYPGQERQFFEFIKSNPQAQQQLRAPIFEEKVVDYIFELAEVSEVEADKDTLQKAVEALEQE